MSLPIEELSPDLREFCREYHIRRLSLFGSAARDEMHEDSDVDLLVEFEAGHVPSFRRLAHLRADLERILGTTRVDVATPSILRNPYRRKAILADLKELYAA